MTSIYPHIEQPVKFVNGKPIHAEGGVKISITAYFQNFVSIKVALKKGNTTTIGDRSYICSFVNIGHDVVIGDDCILATGVKLLGECSLGNHVYVGANAVICTGANIGSWVKVHAGVIVDFDVPDGKYVTKDGIIVENRDKPTVL